MFGGSVLLRVRFCQVFGHVLEEGRHVDLSDQRADRLLTEFASAQYISEGAPKVFTEQTVNAWKTRVGVDCESDLNKDSGLEN